MSWTVCGFLEWKILLSDRKFCNCLYSDMTKSLFTSFLWRGKVLYSIQQTWLVFADVLGLLRFTDHLNKKMIVSLFTWSLNGRHVSSWRSTYVVFDFSFWYVTPTWIADTSSTRANEYFLMLCEIAIIELTANWTSISLVHCKMKTNISDVFAGS